MTPDDASTQSFPVTVGWREWVAFPDIGLPAVRAKVDTGAATSSIHAHAIERFQKGGAPYVRFGVHPFFRKNHRLDVACEAPIVDVRAVRSSNGQTADRIVIGVVFRLGVRSDAHEWPVEVTLANRLRMRFPMLLGREAMEGRVHVDPGASFLLGQVDQPGALYSAPRPSAT